MNRFLSVMVAALVAAACSSNSTDPASDGLPQTALTVPTASTFAGEWKATDPHPDFIRLTVASKSSEQGGFGTRLTFSGVYWEGSGRIQGDAFVASVATPGISGSGVLTARATDSGALRVTLRGSTGTTTEFTFVRVN